MEHTGGLSGGGRADVHILPNPILHSRILRYERANLQKFLWTILMITSSVILSMISAILYDEAYSEISQNHHNMHANVSEAVVIRCYT